MSESQPQLRTHIARFEDGPRDGTTCVVMALESGQPPDILLTPGQPEWIYLLAGGPRRDGSLPYTHMPPSKAAWVRARGRRASSSRASSSRGSSSRASSAR